jgi:RNA polymerase sigma-70 factor (ECF subfamily)
MALPERPGPSELPPLVAAARAGDRASQGRLLREHARLVEWSLRRMVGPTPDLEDLVQEVFVEAIRGLPSYRGDAKFSTWLQRIAVHVACRWLRAPRRRHPTLSLVDADPPQPTRVPEEVDARAASRRLSDLLDRLTPVKRVALLLHVALGHSTREVAALMGSTHTTAKARVWFARREIDAMARQDDLLARWLRENEVRR